MTSFKTPLLLAVLALTCALIAPTRAWSQPIDLDTPADSPLWWTLTDEISPAELRAALRSDRAHLERYLAAVDAGLASPLTEEQADALSFYYNRRLNPELTPMWFAFDVLASGRLQLRGEEAIRQSLAEYGFTKPAIGTIIDAANAQFRDSQQLAKQLAPDTQEFMKIWRLAVERRGGEKKAGAEVDRAVKAGKLDILAQATGTPNERLAKLRRAWKRDPLGEATAPILVNLKDTLDDASWDRLRTYLLEVVVPGLSQDLKDFDYSQEDE